MRVDERTHDREFVRTFFTSPAAVADAADSAKLLRSGAQLRGMQAPDVWVPDNEDGTAPGMREEGVENVVEVLADHGAGVPGEIHPRVVWHRDNPGTRHRGFEQMRRLADPAVGGEHVDGFVIPEVGGLDDWKRADESLRVVEHEYGLPEGSLAMSVVVESAAAELAMGRLREEMGNPSNTLERLFLLVDGEVDYTKDMRAITPTGELPSWPELRHNTARAASAAGLIAVDGPYDDIRDVAGYHERMTDNQAKGMLGIWALTPGQVVEANRGPLPPAAGYWRLSVGDHEVELADEGDTHVYGGDHVSLAETGAGYELTVTGETHTLDGDELRERLLDIVDYVPGLSDIVDSMAEFEAARAAGTGAVAMTRATTVRIDGVAVDLSTDRMWDEATYQALKTPLTLLQDVYESRPDQHDALADLYSEATVERALNLG